MKLAADANVLLSALIGGQANRALNHPAVEEILTTEATLSEVQEYAGRLAQKKHLPLDVVCSPSPHFPSRYSSVRIYVSSMPEARERIGVRDPGDVDLLALALHLDIPVWSNDNDFRDAGIVWYTTASLLAMLERN